MKKTLSTIGVGDVVYTSTGDGSLIGGPYKVIAADETTFEIADGGPPWKYFRDTGKRENYAFGMMRAVVLDDDAVAAHERRKEREVVEERVRGKLDRVPVISLRIIDDARLAALERAVDALFETAGWSPYRNG